MESFTGTHDMLGGQIWGWYDGLGNTSSKNNFEQKASQVTTVSAPFAMADLISSDFVEVLFKLGGNEYEKYVFILLSFLLHGCYYSFKTGCFYAPQSVNCGGKYKSDFDAFQKNGITDEQKLIDIKNCLGKYGNNIDYKKTIYLDLYKRYPNENIAHELTMCMINKGYIFDKKYR